MKRNEYKGAYLFRKGENSTIDHRMEEKYLEMNNFNIKKRKEDRELIDLMENWASSKSKVSKDRHKNF